MSSILWILAALLIAVVGCLVNIVILIRRVNRLKSMVIRQINQEIRLGEIRSRENHFASKESDEMDDIAILLSGMKAHCFGRKAGSNKKFAKSLHRINERVRDLNKNR